MVTSYGSGIVVIVGREILTRFARRHADARGWIANWIELTEGAQWDGPADLKIEYPSASLLSNNRVVFNVKGNRYRMLVQIAYKVKRIAVLRIGTHADYDRWGL